VNRAVGWIGLVAFACGGARQAPRPIEEGERLPARIAIVVSIDGLMPDTYLAPDQHQLAVPTLRMIAQRGARARWAEPVLPTVTYPNHTTIATGAEPSRHGIVSNRAYDPLEKNQSGWRWYSEDIKVSTLWQAVEESGKSAALMQWPVSVGARVRSIVPEYWRASTLEDRKLLRAMSTPGLLEAMPRRFPARWTSRSTSSTPPRPIS
jgi:hypothetical protein